MAKKLMTVNEYNEIVRGYAGKTKYAKGCSGQRLTKELLDKKRKQYPAWYNKIATEVGLKYTTWYEYLLRFCNGAWFAADCCGLIKGIRAGYRPDGTVGTLTREIDQTIAEMVADLEGKHKDVATAKAGEMMYFSDFSHVMSVSKDGSMDIESAPSLGGVEEVKIGYQPLSRVGGAGRLPWVDYGNEETESDDVKFDEITVVRKGSKNEAVRVVQAFVHTTVDGNFGAKTEKAVKEYQEKKGLTPDGIVGEKTWESIIEDL